MAPVVVCTGSPYTYIQQSLLFIILRHAPHATQAPFLAIETTAQCLCLSLRRLGRVQTDIATKGLPLKICALGSRCTDTMCNLGSTVVLPGNHGENDTMSKQNVVSSPPRFLNP